MYVQYIYSYVCHPEIPMGSNDLLKLINGNEIIIYFVSNHDVGPTSNLRSSLHQLPVVLKIKIGI